MPVTLVVGETPLGAPKKEVMLPFALGFFASEEGSSEALRLSDMMIWFDGRRRIILRDSLAVFLLWMGVELGFVEER